MTAMLCLLIYSTCIPSEDHRIATRFGDIILSNMKPGMVYSLKQENRIPYTVINRSGESREMEVTIEKPRVDQLKTDYEPLPDITWISVMPSRFLLGPGEKMECDLIISIPPEEEYQDRHFQAMIVAESAMIPGERIGGVVINFSLANRIRFSTGRRPESFIAEYRDRILAALDMEMTPMSMFIREKVELGKKVRMDGRDYLSPQIVNRSRENYRIELKIVDDPWNYGLASGYAPVPKDVKIKVRRRRIRVRPRSLSDVEVEMEIPDREEFRGKQYAFVVKGEVTGFDIPIELFSRVYFTTEK